MRSIIRDSGRVILLELIHSAKAPASRVVTTPTTAMFQTAKLALAFSSWLALALAASSASLKARISPLSARTWVSTSVARLAPCPIWMRSICWMPMP